MSIQNINASSEVVAGRQGLALFLNVKPSRAAYLLSRKSQSGIPVHRVGRSVFCIKSELLDWLRKR